MTKTKIFLVLCAVMGFAIAVVFGLHIGKLLHNRKELPAPSKSAALAEKAETQHKEPTEPTLPPPEETIFTPMDFAYDGAYMTCLNYPYVQGIDVSRYQGDIRWEEVKNAGFDFVMIKVGARGYGEKGTLISDPKAVENYENASAAGLKVGAYFFSQATSVAEAREEAAYMLELMDGWQLDMPVVYDWECLGEDYRTVGVDARTVTDCAIAFCEDIAAGGYQPMIYFNANQSREQMYLSELTDYKFWLALYTDHMTYEYKVDMWQYTNQGRVPGIDANVDINLYFPYEEVDN